MLRQIMCTNCQVNPHVELVQCTECETYFKPSFQVGCNDNDGIGFYHHRMRYCPMCGAEAEVKEGV